MNLNADIRVSIQIELFLACDFGPIPHFRHVVCLRTVELPKRAGRAHGPGSTVERTKDVQSWTRDLEGPNKGINPAMAKRCKALFSPYG